MNDAIKKHITLHLPHSAGESSSSSSRFGLCRFCHSWSVTLMCPQKHFCFFLFLLFIISFVLLQPFFYMLVFSYVSLATLLPRSCHSFVFCN